MRLLEVFLITSGTHPISFYAHTVRQWLTGDLAVTQITKQLDRMITITVPVQD